MATNVLHLPEISPSKVEADFMVDAEFSAFG